MLFDDTENPIRLPVTYTNDMRRRKKSRTKPLLISLAVALFASAGSWYALSLYGPLQDTEETVQAPAEPNEAPEEPEPLACVAAMPLTTRIGQKLMAAGYSDQIENETKVFAAHYIGGIIIMDEIAAERIAAFRSAMPITPLVAVDQEGGTVQRYKSQGILPGAEQLAHGGSTDTAHRLYLRDSEHLRSQGITTNFAPVVDVMSHEPSPLPGRMYSSDPFVVTKYATSSIAAMQQAGITPVIKHFPGLGSASGNTDFEATTTAPLSELRSRDLIPYQELASLQPDVMIGNMVVPELTGDQPAVWSKGAVDLLRSFGYENAVVYSDSLTAEAVPGNLVDAAIKSWQAGVDIALIVQHAANTTSLDTYFQQITERATAALESGAIDDDAFNVSVLRILTRKQLDPCTLAS